MTSAADIIKEIIAEKNKGARRLSLRALAHRIKIPSGRLSELLSGKRELSDYYLEKIFKALRLSNEEIARIRSAHHTRIKSKNAKEAQPDVAVIPRELMEKTLNWKIYGILSVVETEPYLKFTQNETSQNKQIEFIGQKLLLSAKEISAFITILESVDFLRWNANQHHWAPFQSETTTVHDIPTPVIQSYHSDVLELAKKKLVDVPVYNRDFSNMTMTMDMKDMLKAKKMLRDFRRTFTKKIESGKKQDVFQLSLQFFPLTDVGTEK